MSILSGTARARLCGWAAVLAVVLVCSESHAFPGNKQGMNIHPPVVDVPGATCPSTATVTVYFRNNTAPGGANINISWVSSKDVNECVADYNPKMGVIGPLAPGAVAPVTITLSFNQPNCTGTTVITFTGTRVGSMPVETDMVTLTVRCNRKDPIKVQFAKECPENIWQNMGRGPIREEYFQNMGPWGSNGFKNGGFHENQTDNKITSIMIKLTSGNTFDVTNLDMIRGDLCTGIMVAEMNTKLTLTGCNIQPGQSFWSKIPRSKGPPGDGVGVGEYTGQVMPAKEKRREEQKPIPDDEPKSGDEEEQFSGFYDPAQGFQFFPGQITFAQYRDGLRVEANNLTESIIGSTISIDPMQVMGPSPDIPGAFSLSDSMIRIHGDNGSYLLGGIVKTFIVPDHSVPGKDAAIEGVVTWATSQVGLVSRFVDELYAPLQPNREVYLVIRGLIFQPTQNLNFPASFSGSAIVTNAVNLDAPGGVPAISALGMVVMGAGLVAVAGLLVRRVARRRVGVAGG